MRKVLICSLIFLVLALATTVPCALCARPPVSPWPPEEKWSPMPPWEARPDYRSISPFEYGEVWFELDPEESFYLWYGWFCMPTNVAYDYEGEPITIPFSLQDHTDMAHCLWTVTWMDDGTTLEPTGQFTANCQWFDVYWEGYIVPKATWYEYYIEFPQGLAEGTYPIEIYGKPTWGEPFSITITLHVAS